MNRWDLAYLAAAPAFLASVAVKRLRHGKYRRSLPGMFGRDLPEEPLPAVRERVWMHSVSVGETVAAAAIFRRLRENHPGWEFLSTATTEPGFEQAARSFAEADHRTFAPVDLSWVVRRFQERWNPSVYIVLETELWPNTLLTCRRRGIPAFLANGKVSEKSFRSYRRLGRLFRPVLDCFTAFLVQTDEGAERLRTLAGPGARIHVTGNVKLDGLPAPLTEEERAAIRREWSVPRGGLAVLAGSTHRGEEELVYKAFRRAADRLGSEDMPEPVLVIAPRHPERFGEAARRLRSAGAAVHPLSEGGTPPPGSVRLLDRMGVLGRSFGAADVAILGGAWNPIGGHNLLEPANHGVPVVHGPHMHSQGEIMRIVRAENAAAEVPEEELAATLYRLLYNREEREALGKRGLQAARRNAGAAGRTVELIEEYLSASK